MQEYLNNIKHVPDTLKKLDIWLCYDDRKEDNPKAPRDLKGNLHSLNQRLFTFNECIESVEKGINSGVGIVLKNNGIVVIDYDNCISGFRVEDKLGIKAPILLNDRVKQINRDLDLINSYTEISPSGKGIHVYLTANSNININTNKEDIEIYTNKFIRVSGNLFNEYLYNQLEDRTRELEQLLNLYNIKLNDIIGNKSAIKQRYNVYDKQIRQQFKYTNKFDIRDIKRTLFNSKKGELIKKLFNNNITTEEFIKLKGKKKSEDIKKIDLSDSGKAITLIMYLYDFCYGDIDKVYKIFKSSSLCKEKYIKKSYANGKEDIIQHCFIPYAITHYNNYRESEEYINKD